VSIVRWRCEIQARCERRGRPAGRPSSAARRVPRVVGGTEDRVERLPIAGQFRCVGLAEDHRAGFAQPPHSLGVTLGHVVPGLEAAGGANASRIVRVLDRHRHSVQRTVDVTAGQRSIGRVRRALRPVGIQRHDSVEQRIQPFDALQITVEQLAARHLTAPQRNRQFVSGARHDLRHGVLMMPDGRFRRGRVVRLLSKQYKLPQRCPTLPDWPRDRLRHTVHSVTGRCRERRKPVTLSTNSDLFKDVYYDPYDVDLNTDPYPMFRRIREEAPLYFNDRHGFYALSRYDDVDAALVDHDTFSS